MINATTTIKNTCDGFWQLPAHCDISNYATATIEIILAVMLASIAVGIAVLFYYKEKRDR